MRIDYRTYLDELLLAVAHMQSGDTPKSVKLKTIHDARFPDAPLTWLNTAATALHKAGYGIDWQSTDNMHVLIDGGGLGRVAEIQRERALQTPTGWIKSISRSDWIAAAALVVAIITLVVSSN